MGLAGALSQLANATALQISQLKEKTVDEDDKINQTCMSTAVIKALKSGNYTALRNFWDRSLAERRASALGNGSLSSTREVKDYDWSDWSLAMLKLGASYIKYGQTNLGHQVYNLLQGAMHLSAIYKRSSIQDACEALRRASTSMDCRWDSSSLFLPVAQVLLELLVARPRFTGTKGSFGKKRRYRQENWELSNSRSGLGDGQRAMNGTQISVMQLPSNKKPKPSSANMCRFWASGSKCNHHPCRFAHNRTSCGPFWGMIRLDVQRP